MEGKNRIAIWDNLRFILIFLVVLGHFADYYTKQSVNMRILFLFIYAFHMPTFIFVSGLFSKRAVAQKDYRKVFEYFVLYLFTKIFLFCMRMIGTGSIGSFSLFAEGGVPWFAFALAVFLLITMALQKLDKRYLFLFSVTLACFAGYDNNINARLALSRIIVFYPFFLAGYYMDANKLLCYFKQKKMMVVSVLALIGIVIVSNCCINRIYWIRPLLTGQNPFESLGDYYKWGILLRAGCYLMSFLLIFITISLTPQKSGVISRWGQRSLQVYVLHYGFVYLFFGILDGEKWVNKIFGGRHIWIVFVSLFVTIVFSQKFWWKLLEPFIKPKWNEN